MNHYTYIDRSRGPVVGEIQQTWKTQSMTDWLMKMYGKYIEPCSLPYYGPYLQVHEGEVIFECNAGDILEADKLLIVATGVIASKRSDV